MLFKVIAQAFNDIVYRLEDAGRRQPEVTLNGRYPDNITHRAAGRQRVDLLEIL